MKLSVAVLAVVTIAAAAPQTLFAQAQFDEQAAQQACQNDVFSLCNDAVPDRKRIEVCLRKNWKSVSHECREVMASYGGKHHRRMRSSVNQ